MADSIDLRRPAYDARPKVPELPHLKDVAIATWRGRMQNEYASAQVFEGLARQLEEAAWDEGDVAECRAFADEERRHGVLCGAVVEALGGEAIGTLPEQHPFPEHRDAPSRLEAATRNLLSISCLSETVAVALIGAEREEMSDGELKDLLTRIWSDEIGHSRFGWRVAGRAVGKLDRDARRRLELYLRVAFAHLEAHELAHLPIHYAPPPEGAALGLCDGRDARALFYATVENAIVPGLEAIGLSAKEAWMLRKSGEAPLD